ncbi:MAG: hypothetical protein IJC98_06320 [Clostridia bacterium]|nr:hypothetical protein [Clostridia bacterium]
MKKNRKHLSPPVVGGISLLVIFSVLCLTVFSLLTISTALAEKRLSDVSANTVSAYYAADSEAERIFASIRRGEIPADVTVTENRYSYTVPITETLSLQVALLYENGGWTVLQWRSVTANS